MTDLLCIAVDTNNIPLSLYLIDWAINNAFQGVQSGGGGGGQEGENQRLLLVNARSSPATNKTTQWVQHLFTDDDGEEEELERLEAKAQQRGLEMIYSIVSSFATVKVNCEALVVKPGSIKSGQVIVQHAQLRKCSKLVLLGLAQSEKTSWLDKWLESGESTLKECLLVARIPLLIVPFPSSQELKPFVTLTNAAIASANISMEQDEEQDEEQNEEQEERRRKEEEAPFIELQVNEEN